LRRALDEGIEGMRTLTYYVGSSLDGFIAAPDGSIDAFPVTEDVIEFIGDRQPIRAPGAVRGLDHPARQPRPAGPGRGR
jgi:hypothetical protein